MKRLGPITGKIKAADLVETRNRVNEIIDSLDAPSKQKEEARETYMLPISKFTHSDMATLQKGRKCTYKGVLYYWHEGSFHYRHEQEMPDSRESAACVPAWAMICNTTREKEIKENGEFIDPLALSITDELEAGLEENRLKYVVNFTGTRPYTYILLPTAKYEEYIKSGGKAGEGMHEMGFKPLFHDIPVWPYPGDKTIYGTEEI